VEWCSITTWSLAGASEICDAISRRIQAHNEENGRKAGRREKAKKDIAAIKGGEKSYQVASRASKRRSRWDRRNMKWKLPQGMKRKKERKSRRIKTSLLCTQTAYANYASVSPRPVEIKEMAGWKSGRVLYL
jgi:hypothetical protein